MTIYASTKTRNTDPTPWVIDQAGAPRGLYRYPSYSAAMADYAPERDGDTGVRLAPHPEFDQPRAHDGNPVLIAAREDYDDSDPWGFALGWLDAIDRRENYPARSEAEAWGESDEVQTAVSLHLHDGEWTLPRATPEHFEHARRVFDRMADVARANGQDY